MKRQDLTIDPPGLHIINNTKVVFVPANSPLDFVEEISQLHEDNQAGHGQPDVPKQLLRDRQGRQKVKSRTKELKPPSHQHVYVVNQVQKEHGQLHDKVGVVDVRSFVLPGPWMLQVPEVNGVSEERSRSHWETLGEHWDHRTDKRRK